MRAGGEFVDHRENDDGEAGNRGHRSVGDGRELYRSQTGGAMASDVISYNRKGRQYVAAVAGNVLRLTFG